MSDKGPTRIRRNSITVNYEIEMLGRRPYTVAVEDIFWGEEFENTEEEEGENLKNDEEE